MKHRIACTLLVILAGCGEAPRPNAELLAQGRAVYNFRCYFCHGYSGNAKTLAATYLTPQPRDFSAATPAELPLPRIITAVRDGKAGTAMKSFSGVISEAEIEAVSAFVHDEFVVRKATNTRYHTPENGWPNHERYRAAFPFALGEVALTVEWTSLTPDQQRGRTMFINSCMTCHDRGKPTADPVQWESRALSYPRNNYDHKNPEVDAATSATPYRLHDVPPRLERPTPRERQGEKLFQDNCAFCHAADGTGKNWIGAFLEPHPRNLTDPNFMTRMTPARLTEVIREGLPQTSMPAWKSVLSAAEIEAIVAYINTAFHPLAP
jgi:cytochrome c oxidase cbb3-type subunit III